MSTENQVNPFTSETSQQLRIPLRRIGAVIGVKGSNRIAIEERTQTKIIIDSDTGEVEIRAGKDLKDPVQLLNARDIVRAIGRGFTPEQALRLADDAYFLEVIGLKAFIGNRPNHLQRVKGRLIGTEGRTRKTFEELTGALIVVAGTTVSIIGELEQVQEAKDAITEIINGAQIESVIGQLEAKKQELKREEDRLWKSEDEAVDPSELMPDEKPPEDPFADYDED